MERLLKGKTSVITGCRRGIGKAILEVFAKQGSNIFACLRKPDEEFTQYLNTLSQESDVTITPVYFDLADAAQVKAGAQAIMSSKAPVDVLINNAGMIFTAPFQMTSIEKMKEVFEINYFSQMLFTQYMVRMMSRHKKGSIVNLSSSAGIEGNEGRVAYASAKASMIASTKVLSKELAAHGIRVNAIAPGLTQTEMMESSTPKDALAATLQRTCLKRVGEVHEIANVALFLASDLSSYMTGQTLRVDGGM